MSERIDPETGEVLEASPSPRQIPREIAGAIIQVMRGVKQLGFDENNPHAKYNYASIDKFLLHFGPACAEAGITFMLDEVSVEVRAVEGRRDDRSGEQRVSSYLFIEYEVWIVHQLGAMAGPWKRRCYLPATGPQAFGSAESYVLKRFMRNLFQVPTGEKDADAEAPGDLPSRTHAAPASRVTPARQAPQQAASTDAGRESYRYVNQLIASCRTAEDLRDVYDPVLEEWGEAARNHIETIRVAAASGPKNVETLAGRARDRINQLLQEPEYV